MLAGFAAMRALSTRNDEPARASRPFDLDRDGFVIGEGAGVLVLEELEHARARGATIRAPRARLRRGTATRPTWRARPRTARARSAAWSVALADADLAPADVDYVNAHATSTPAGDRGEARAMRAVFGAHVDASPVSATKSMTGHLLGAAGAVEAILCVRALETGMLPPTINLDRPDPECALDHVAQQGAARARARRALERVRLRRRERELAARTSGVG